MVEAILTSSTDESLANEDAQTAIISNIQNMQGEVQQFNEALIPTNPVYDDKERETMTYGEVQNAQIVNDLAN